MAMQFVFMVNKSDVEIRYINIYKIEQSSLSIRVTVPSPREHSHRHSHSRRFLDGVLSLSLSLRLIRRVCFVNKYYTIFELVIENTSVRHEPT